MGGGFGHFYAYAPEKFEYAIDRFTMEAKASVGRFGSSIWRIAIFLAGDEYSIADIATAPWYGSVLQGTVYDAAEFLDAGSYKNVNRWADAVMNRPAYLRGKMVNRKWGEPSEQLRERHDASDFELKTQDKIES